MKILPAKILPALAWLTRHPADQIAAEQARLKAAAGERRDPPLTAAKSQAPVAMLPAPDAPPAKGNATQSATEDGDDNILRHISPRDFADLMHELYIGGVLNWEEYRMVGFPSQLHPRFDETIGSLTGEKAAPDQPQDMLGEWERRVDFEQRHKSLSPETAARAERILDVLRWQSEPPVEVAV